MQAKQELGLDPTENRVNHAELVMRLRAYRERLGITDEPDTQVHVTFTTGLPGRPIGAILPVFSPKKCGTDDRGYKYTLYNLMAFTGFEIPENTDLF